MGALILLLALVACGLSLVASALSLVLAGIFRRSPSAGDRAVGLVLAAMGLLWTVGPAGLALWSSQTQHETALLILLLAWGALSGLLAWGLARGIEVAARP